MGLKHSLEIATDAIKLGLIAALGIAAHFALFDFPLDRVMP